MSSILQCYQSFISSLISCLIFVETNVAVLRTRTQKPCLSMCGSNPSLLHVTIKTKVGDKKQPLNRVRCPLIQISIFFKKKLNNTQWINQVRESCRVAVNIRIYTHMIPASLSSVGCLITLLQLLFKCAALRNWLVSVWDQSCFNLSNY